MANTKLSQNETIHMPWKYMDRKLAMEFNNGKKVNPNNKFQPCKITTNDVHQDFQELQTL
jgi:hypothetical protein